jgi:hypothetical protein
MGSALGRIYIIDKTIAVLRVGIIVLHGHFHRHAVLLSFTENDLRIKRFFAFVEILNEFDGISITNSSDTIFVESVKVEK